MTAKQSAKTRINRVLRFYEKRGVNSERVNNLYRKIINDIFKVANS